MPRPKLHSDAAILDAAQRVILARGPERFTLSDVAAEIGISRAALIQRFGDKATLHLRVMERATREVEDYFAAAPPAVGLVALWTLLEDLIAGLGSGEGFAGHLLLEWSDVTDPALNRLKAQRDRLVRDAIVSRLPEAPHERAVAGRLVQAVIQGATMQWLVEKSGPLDRFVIARTREMLVVLYPGQRLD